MFVCSLMFKNMNNPNFGNETLFNPQPNNFPQRNSDLPSDRRESVADRRELICVSSKSVEFLSSANGNRGSSKFKVIIKSKGH